MRAFIRLISEPIKLFIKPLAREAELCFRLVTKP